MDSRKGRDAGRTGPSPILAGAGLFVLVVSASPAAGQVDFSTDGPFPSSHLIVLDRKTPLELGFDDVPIMADLWGWTDPDSGEEYVIATGDAHNVPFPVRGADQAASVYDPVGGVVFARLTASGSIEPLGVWRHPTLEKTDHGDVQVFAHHAYVTGEASGYGLVIFDLTKLRDRAACGSPANCAATLLNDVPGFGVVRSELRDPWGRTTSFSDGHNLTIDEVSGFMAIHAANTEKNARPRTRRARSTKVLRIDPADPTHPILIQDLERASHDGMITRYEGPDLEHRGKIIMALANGYKHQFIDANDVEVLNNPKNGPAIYQLTDPDGETVNIRKLSHLITYEDDDFGHQLWLSGDHRHIFFNDEAQTPDSVTGRQIVFDISSLKTPVEIFQCFYPVETVTHDGYVVGNLLFNANYTSGLRVVDVSDVESTMCDADGLLNEVAFVDTEPRLNSFSDVLTFDVGPDVTLRSDSLYAGQWGNYPFFPSGRIVVSDFFNGIFLLQLDLP